MDAATFRNDFPEFASLSAFPDSQVNFYLSLADKMLRPEAWDDLLDHGTELFTAHHLSLARRNQLSAAKGGVPGSNAGPTSSKAVDKVSVSYDTGSASLAGAGHWNLTVYGTQFYQLLQIVGIGGVQAWGGGAVVGGGALAMWQDGLPRWP